MQDNDIKQLLEQAFNQCTAQVQSDGRHFEVQVISDDFAGMSPVKKKQMVYRVLAKPIQEGTIHALVIKTYTKSNG